MLITSSPSAMVCDGIRNHMDTSQHTYQVKGDPVSRAPHHPCDHSESYSLYKLIHSHLTSTSDRSSQRPVQLTVRFTSHDALQDFLQEQLVDLREALKIV